MSEKDFKKISKRFNFNYYLKVYKKSLELFVGQRFTTE